MNLINALKEPNARRIFGKQELKIIEKQLKGIRLTPSEKTRLSRDIKKKFIAIQLLSSFPIDVLKKGSEVKKIIEDVKKEILEGEYSPRIEKIVLFGSTIDNLRTFRSDIDIAVYFDRIEDKEAVKFRISILKNFNNNIDVQVYNVLPLKLKKEIDEKGRVIYERNGKQ